MKPKKYLSIRIDFTSYRKLSYIANQEGRSLNGQIVYLVHKCITDFENGNKKTGYDDK